ncbi:hypothetical protein Tco_1184755, partial [Tanacetum coccineum]
SLLSIGWEGDVVSGRLMLGLFDAGTEVSAKVVHVSCREGEDAGVVSGVGVVVIVVPAKVACVIILDKKMVHPEGRVSMLKVLVSAASKIFYLQLIGMLLLG